MYKIYLGLISLLLATIFISCDKEESYGTYVGVPSDLRYSEMVEGSYIVGEGYVSQAPTLFTNGEISYEIVNITSTTDLPLETMMESINIIENEGIIRILPYSNLLEGTYNLDIKVTNPSGSTTFDGVYSFSAITGQPNHLSYSPSIISVFSNELGEVSKKPQVTGGGPYNYILKTETENFAIDAETGIISYTTDLLLGSQDKVVKELFVEVSNSVGDFTSLTPYYVEVIGSSLGKLSYIMEFTEPSSVSYGVVNCDIVNYYGEITTTINEEPYTTTLNTEINGPKWNGNEKTIPYNNVFFNDLFRIKYDVTGGGKVVESPTLGMSTTNTSTEAISLVSLPVVDLTSLTEAYINIEGFKRYIDEDSNQQLELMITKEEDFNTEDNFDSNWTMLDPNIAPLLLQISGTTAKESEIKNSGSSTTIIPSEFLGLRVKIALKGVYLKPTKEGGSNLGREYHISKLEVRTKS